MTRTDGGAAFPYEVRASYHHPGMSLRNYFAGQALIGLMMAHAVDVRDGRGKTAIVREAYKYADEMIDANTSER